jgi:predicted nucleic acid-binding Zn ribbon protein
VSPDSGDVTPGAPDEVPGDGVTPRRDDGLDLARTLARATARSTPGRQTLDVALTRVVDDHGWQVDLKVASMFARWGELVGAEVGAHSGPESFADGKLVVRTDSTAWATQLKLLAPAIVRRLNEDLGHGTVLVIDILGPHAPSWKRGQRSVRDGRGPRDTYG